MWNQFNSLPSLIKGRWLVTTLAIVAYFALLVVIIFSQHINDYFGYTAPVQQVVAAAPAAPTPTPDPYAELKRQAETADAETLTTPKDEDLSTYLQSTLGPLEGTMYFESSRESATESTTTGRPLKFLIQL